MALGRDRAHPHPLPQRVPLTIHPARVITYLALVLFITACRSEPATEIPGPPHLDVEEGDSLLDVNVRTPCDVGDGCFRGCEPSSVRCEDNMLITCSSDGNHEGPTDCGIGVCVEEGGTAHCADMTCEPHETGCVDSWTAYVCNGTGSLRAEFPCLEGRYCDTGTCRDQDCAPNTAGCDGNVALACDERGAAVTRVNCGDVARCRAAPAGCACRNGSCEARRDETDAGDGDVYGADASDANLVDAIDAPIDRGEDATDVDDTERVSDGSRHPDSSDGPDLPVDAGEDQPDVSDTECTPACHDRECGPGPVCGIECGTCDNPALPVCNDGNCAFRCDDTLCEAFSSCTEVFPELCVPRDGHFCGSEGNLQLWCQEYSCSEDRSSCDSIEAERLGRGCSRDPAGQLVPESEELGECVFANECAETTNAVVTAERCVDGEPVREVQGTEVCTRSTIGSACHLETSEGTCVNGECSTCAPLPADGHLVVDDELSAADSPQWDLPNFDDCTIPASGLALYASHVFCNAGPTRAFEIQAEGGLDDDTLTLGAVAVFAYQSDGFPPDTQDCIDESDNHPDGGAILPDVTVGSGGRLTIIVSSFSDVIDGTYRLVVSPE